MAIYIFAFAETSNDNSRGTSTNSINAVSMAFLVLIRPENSVPSSAKLGGIV